MEEGRQKSQAEKALEQSEVTERREPGRTGVVAKSGVRWSSAVIGHVEKTGFCFKGLGTGCEA